MSRYCLDTSAYSHFKRGHPPIVDLVDRSTWIGLPAIVVGELQAGFLLGGRCEGNQKELAEFVRDSVVEELPIDSAIGQIYAEIVVELRRNGTPIPSNDIWIAATAANADAIVVTYDAHFSAIQRVGCLLLQA